MRAARLRSWWQFTKQHRLTILVVAIVLVVVIVLIIVGYQFDWTGFNGNNKSGKTLWDWLQLLIIPAVLAVAGYVINLTISRGEQAATEQRAKSESEAAEKRATTEREIAQDNQREAALQKYIDNMSELLLKEHLGELTLKGELNPEYEQVGRIARIQTITVLNQLDARRIGLVFAFLKETGLMSTTSSNSVVNLKGADLCSVNWSRANLNGADLREADLRKTNLSNANLSEALQLHLFVDSVLSSQL